MKGELVKRYKGEPTGQADMTGRAQENEVNKVTESERYQLTAIAIKSLQNCRFHAQPQLSKRQSLVSTHHSSKSVAI